MAPPRPASPYWLSRHEVRSGRSRFQLGGAQAPVAHLLVHHTRKAPAGNAGTGLRGSSDLHAFGDPNLYLRKLAQEVLELKIERRAPAPPTPVRLKLHVGEGNSPRARFCAVERKDQEDPAAHRVLDLLTK